MDVDLEGRDLVAAGPRPARFMISEPAHVPAKHALGLDPRVDPVRQGEPLFADKDMRQNKNLRRFPVISVH